MADPKNDEFLDDIEAAEAEGDGEGQRVEDEDGGEEDRDRDYEGAPRVLELARHGTEGEEAAVEPEDPRDEERPVDLALVDPAARRLDLGQPVRGEDDGGQQRHDREQRVEADHHVGPQQVDRGDGEDDADGADESAQVFDRSQ